MQRSIACLLIFAPVLILSLGQAADAQRLFVGLESSPAPPTRSTDLAGFPDVTWEDHFTFEVSGAAATPEGLLYLCNGAFTTDLYQSAPEGPPQFLATISEDMSALAYGRSTLWGYSNYADPKGIYEIDPTTGEATLVLDVYTGTGYRFFALDFNPADDKLYGYTEYGTTGLYRIDIDSGDMTFIVERIPATNGQGRGMAVGNNTVYLTATRGDDDIPYFAYDLMQGIGGEWVGFTNPYPEHHSTGGAAWIPDPAASVGEESSEAAAPALQLLALQPNPTFAATTIAFELGSPGSVEVGIFDPTGRRVALLVARDASAGGHTLEWSGHDSRGLRVPTGTYFVRVRADGRTVARALTLLR